MLELESKRINLIQNKLPVLSGRQINELARFFGDRKKEFIAKSEDSDKVNRAAGQIPEGKLQELKHLEYVIFILESFIMGGKNTEREIYDKCLNKFREKFNGLFFTMAFHEVLKKMEDIKESSENDSDYEEF